MCMRAHSCGYIEMGRDVSSYRTHPFGQCPKYQAAQSPLSLLTSDHFVQNRKLNVICTKRSASWETQDTTGPPGINPPIHCRSPRNKMSRQKYNLDPKFSRPPSIKPLFYTRPQRTKCDTRRRACTHKLTEHRTNSLNINPSCVLDIGK